MKYPNMYIPAVASRWIKYSFSSDVNLESSSATCSLG